MNASELLVPVVQRHGDRFTERNGYLYALLGLVVAGRRLEGLVDRAQPAPGSPASSTAGGEQDDAAASEAWVFFVLGLVATRKTFQRVVDEWTSVPARSAMEGEDADAAVSGLLR